MLMVDEYSCMLRVGVHVRCSMYNSIFKAQLMTSVTGVRLQWGVGSGLWVCIYITLQLLRARSLRPALCLKINHRHVYVLHYI